VLRNHLSLSLHVEIIVICRKLDIASWCDSIYVFHALRHQIDVLFVVQSGSRSVVVDVVKDTAEETLLRKVVVQISSRRH